MGGDLSLAGVSGLAEARHAPCRRSENYIGRAVSRPSPHGALGLPGPQA